MNVDKGYRLTLNLTYVEWEYARNYYPYFHW